MPKRLTEDKVRAYNEDGFVSPVPVLTGDEVARLRAG